MATEEEIEARNRVLAEELVRRWDGYIEHVLNSPLAAYRKKPLDPWEVALQSNWPAIREMILDPREAGIRLRSFLPLWGYAHGRESGDTTALDLDAIEARALAATPGPWYSRFLDDDLAMNLVAVSTVPDSPQIEYLRDADPSTMVCATLLQSGPDTIGRGSTNWDQDAEFIAHARQDVPTLVAYARLLEQKIAALEAQGKEAAERWHRLKQWASTLADVPPEIVEFLNPSKS